MIKVKEDMMMKTCSTHWRNAQFLSENLKGRDHSKDLSIAGKMTLKDTHQ
jgi:hypothetical protein